MDENPPYIGQRRSYGGALCSVRYYGPLSGTKGEWLGVEWDDPTRGKHDGVHEGQRIFQCLSSSPTAASFVRPSRKPDPERTLLEAIRFKYGRAKKAPHGEAGGVETTSTIAISGKVVEEVGFEKIQKQLSVLAELRIVLADELTVIGVARRDATTQEIEGARQELGKTCPSIAELDIGWNPIETWQDVAYMSQPFKKLKILKASGLRLHDYQRERFAKKDQSFQHVEELHLSECLLEPEQVIQILSPSASIAFPALKTLMLLDNNFDSFTLVARVKLPSITTIIFDNNKFTSLSCLKPIFSLFPNTTTLSFQGNMISHIGLDAVASGKLPVFENLETLNLTGNNIQDYSFVNYLPTVFPNLTSLRISRNPLYQTSAQQEPQDRPSEASKQPERGSQTAGAQSDSISYYLTLARIPKLVSLNYTTITSRDREEGEIYYLSVAEKEISLVLDTVDRDRGSDSSKVVSALESHVDSIRGKHPLYSSLCAKYERDDLLERALQIYRATAHTVAEVDGAGGVKTNIETYAAGTLGSRLVDAFFYVPDTVISHADGILSTAQPPLNEGSPVGVETGSLKSLSRALPTTISVYRLKSLVAKSFSLAPLQFKLVYESHEYDPVEPISRNTGAANDGGGDHSDEKNSWVAWGDWDVDSSESESRDDGDRNDDQSAKTTVGDDGCLLREPLFIVRDGQRFKKRETQILDGMRPWGDFLDLEGSPWTNGGGGREGRLLRGVRVRVEPF
ncbi:uncharacterized protein A1O9_07662 [Exophiala aquamarina CBS 119918]|uniref:CAP-Gly domain-containing protein n=1 Tax=Exophiala aquamarina CBS 119918 TaxID=1182545 RepID=A0A072P869_9EURO|nr:uncharacterized protein A1O9_07662 [Exophiala aquamarina CBS 119918]KEF56081.1 hypothetical protein A1O9_07662 [Exophiala aquamarina CBS 119918]